MLEFKENEDYCRWNDILMTPEKCIELFGGDLHDGSCMLEDGTCIVYEDNNIYIESDSLVNAIVKYLKHMVYEEYKYSFSDRLAERHGFVDVETDYILNAEVIENIPHISLLDKSKYNLELYFQFKEELDKYYSRYV